jgi:hypothetical protein
MYMYVIYCTLQSGIFASLFSSIYCIYSTVYKLVAVDRARYAAPPVPYIRFSRFVYTQNEKVNLFVNLH